MGNPADVSVLIYSTTGGIARTMRMALRGIGVRLVHLAADETQLRDGFATIDPGAVVIYVDGPENDPGLDMLRFLRRGPNSPNVQIPVVVASPRRDLVTINAVINAGGHEYVVFPASGDQLLKKITAARNSNRPFIDTPDYVGPCRRRRVDPQRKGPERRAEIQAKAETKAS